MRAVVSLHFQKFASRKLEHCYTRDTPAVEWLSHEALSASRTEVLIGTDSQKIFSQKVFPESSVLKWWNR
jgi:hypothetical protein